VPEAGVAFIDGDDLCLSSDTGGDLFAQRLFS
jgi:hypothetical protein